MHMPVRRKHQHAFLSSTALVPAQRGKLKVPQEWRGDGRRRINALRILWRANEYERTCADCGYAWRVPRSARHRPDSGFSLAPRGRSITLGRLNPVVPDSEPEIAASEEISEGAAAYARCPGCGWEHYTQRPARS
jgi:hypothetical protein